MSQYNNSHYLCSIKIKPEWNITASRNCSTDVICAWLVSDGLTKAYVLHAEANAITKVARSNNSAEGSTLYVTASPCLDCAKLIIQSGIKRVVYSELYRITDGIDLLKRAGVECCHIADAGPLSESAV